MNMRSGTTSILLSLCLMLAGSARAFLPPVAQEGPLKVSIEAPDTVKAIGEAVAVTIVLDNAGSTSLAGRVELWVVDDWRLDGEPRLERPIALAPGASERIGLQLAAGPWTYNALYPIHARALVSEPTGARREAHAIKIFNVEAPNPANATRRTEGPVAIQAGLTPLQQMPARNVAIRLGESGTTQSLGADWRGTHEETGTVLVPGAIDRGERRPALQIHPPWRKGWGEVWADYDLALPAVKPIALTFATAIRDTAPGEGASDGVAFKVLADGKSLFERFTSAKQWEAASVDLSAYAGRRVTLRLWAGPGPRHNTVCDSGYWGAPTLLVGAAQKPPAAGAAVASPADRQALAIRRASRARQGVIESFAWTLRTDAGLFGAGVAPGPHGIADAAIAFCGATPDAPAIEKILLFDGFDVQIDGRPIGDYPMLQETPWFNAFGNGVGMLGAALVAGGKPANVRIEIRATSGALRFQFAMPGVARDERGHPRFTTLGLGPALHGGRGAPTSAAGAAAVPAELAGVRPRRVYAGFGNVIEKPGKFSFGSNGFQLSTRHVGVDYENGLSLVQASDVFPDRLAVDADRFVVALQTHHDATVSLIPSATGAYAAARIYREGIAAFKPAPALDRLQGRMCLDYWGTSYQHGIDTVEALAPYGVTDCVYVWHNWQRHGYDYRLPDIYPARGDHGLFLKLAETCRRHGILFCPHDNYIDFYPDASGYSYRHIIFNEDGTPQRAWFNRGRGAQSYRWLPHAFQPWLKRNAWLLMQDVKPDAYFIDVFTAIEPMDYHDHTGRFYPKTETIRHWYESFDYIREAFLGAPQICEAGSDHHIGHLEAGESDHNGVAFGGAREWSWNAPCGDAERTPWHDMASHGAFILFGGGLANRYINGRDGTRPGYGSDDYLSLTVLGGRNPMVQGDASAATVRTYWLLHDICKELGARPIISHAFGDDDIHRQIVRFGEDGAVHVNRGGDDWSVEGATLPPYGFLARTNSLRADVLRRQGAVTSFAESGQGLFADARPPLGETTTATLARPVIDFGPVATNGAFRLTVEGERSARALLLPGCPAAEIRLRPARIAGLAAAGCKSIVRIDGRGQALGEAPFEQKNGEIIFRTSAGDFGYRVAFE